MAACAKHFPGHGDTTVDSHVGLPTVGPDLAGALEPFRAAVAAGVATVMTGHLLVPGYGDLPATLNPRAGRRAAAGRARLRRRGRSPTRWRWARSPARSALGEGAVLAVLAGVDALCLGGDEAGEPIADAARDALVAAVRSGRLAEERLAAAAGRVRALAGRFPGSLAALGLAAARRGAAVGRATCGWGRGAGAGASWTRRRRSRSGAPPGGSAGCCPARPSCGVGPDDPLPAAAGRPAAGRRRPGRDPGRLGRARGRRPARRPARTRSWSRWACPGRSRRRAAGSPPAAPRPRAPRAAAELLLGTGAAMIAVGVDAGGTGSRAVVVRDGVVVAAARPRPDQRAAARGRGRPAGRRGHRRRRGRGRVRAGRAALGRARAGAHRRAGPAYRGPGGRRRRHRRGAGRGVRRPARDRGDRRHRLGRGRPGRGRADRPGRRARVPARRRGRRLLDRPGGGAGGAAGRRRHRPGDRADRGGAARVRLAGRRRDGGAPAPHRARPALPPGPRRGRRGAGPPAAGPAAAGQPRGPTRAADAGWPDGGRRRRGRRQADAATCAEPGRGARPAGPARPRTCRSPGSAGSSAARRSGKRSGPPPARPSRSSHRSSVRSGCSTRP